MSLLTDKAALLLPYRSAETGSAHPLRVGIVLGHKRLSRWVDALVRWLREIPGMDVRLVTFAGSRAESRRSAWLTDRLYSASRAKFDPFGDVAGEGVNSDHLESPESLRALGCGVILWLGDSRDPGLELRGLAEHGVFTVRLGERNRGIPFWDEVANDRVTSTAAIFWHEASFRQGRAVRLAEISTTQGLFVTRNAEEPLAATIRMLATLCLELQHGGSQFEERLRGFANEPMEEPAPADYPSNFETGRFVARKLARSAHLRWTTRGRKRRWFIAMRRNAGGSILDPNRLDLTGFREVPLPPGSEAMADPFPWEEDGHVYLFFEDVPAGSRRGRLACAEVSEDGSLGEMKIVLERDYHLSYPCIVPARGERFLLPETGEAGRVDLYRFSRFPWEVEFVSSLVEGLALVDTTPIFLNDRWYFFTTTARPYMESLLFWSDRLDGAWNLHPCSPVSCSVANSRGAGHLFWKNGRLFRPTQDCSVRYGYAIRVNEIIRLTPSEFEEREVSRVSPMWHPGLIGTHTWNESDSLQVLDGRRLVS